MRGGIDAKLQFRLLSVVCRETFEQQCAKAGASAATEGVEDKETLETRAVLGEATKPVHDGVDEFLAHGVVTTRV